MHEARYTEHEKESKQGTDEIKKLKEELQELKTRSQADSFGPSLSLLPAQPGSALARMIQVWRVI